MKQEIKYPVKIQVDPTISLEDLLKENRITNYLDLGKIEDYGDFKTPAKPYTVTIFDPKENKGKSVDEVRKNLKKNQRGATAREVISFYSKYPEILREIWLDCPGSEYGSGSAPCLRVWGGRPRFDYYWADFADPRYGSLVAGVDIEPLVVGTSGKLDLGSLEKRITELENRFNNYINAIADALK